MSASPLREGLLYDHLGRLKHQDARTRTVSAMQKRYNVDLAQAQRVAKTALTLLRQCSESWNLGSELTSSMLEWAALLHEIGLDISHDGYQRHGAYIAANADMPGFPWVEQRILAFLIERQRRQIEPQNGDRIPSTWLDQALRLAILLRLAVLLNRSRSKQELPGIVLSVADASLQLGFPRGWLDDNPLTIADLRREQQQLVSINYRLSFE